MNYKGVELPDPESVAFSQVDECGDDNTDCGIWYAFVKFDHGCLTVPIMVNLSVDREGMANLAELGDLHSDPDTGYRLRAAHLAAWVYAHQKKDEFIATALRGREWCATHL